MKVQIRVVDTQSFHVHRLLPEASLRKHLTLSTHAWIGFVDEDVACVWGLIPPTMMSDQAYLWLHVTDKLKGHEFNLIRHSQRMIEHMLNEFPVIVGFVEVGNDKAQRWITWLGAEFDFPQGHRIPFVIRRK